MAVRITILVACLSVFSAGCSSLSMNKIGKSSVESQVEANATNEYSAPNALPIRGAAQQASSHNSNPGAPTRMAVIWNEKVLNMPSAAPVRGYAGRIYFYDTNDQPVRVQGELTVYGYDDSKEIRSNIADNKYVFPADKFQEHYNESELGPAYSVWIPWENPAGFRKAISLVPVFKTSENFVVQGGATRLTLSGKKPVNSTIEKTVISSTLAADQSRPAAAGGVGYRQPGIQQRPEVQALQVPRAISARMSDVEAARFSPFANRQLDQAMSPGANPNGEMFNRTSVQNFQPSYPNRPFAPTGQLTNLNDGGPAVDPRSYQPSMHSNTLPYVNGQISQPPSVEAPQPVRGFGRPGPIR